MYIYRFDYNLLFAFHSMYFEGRPGISDVALLSGISGVLFHSPFSLPNPLALSAMSFFFFSFFSSC